MKKQIRSFRVAFAGLYTALRTEAHLRFHLVAAFYVIVFGLFYDFTMIQWSILLVLIVSVISSELVNTAIENVCDTVTKEKNQNIKIAKDCSAAAVLLFCAVAVSVAFMFFFDIEKIQEIALFFWARPWLLILLVLSLIMSVVFIGKFKEKK